ncbi:MAG TPA: flavin reductase family protein [Anaerolineales bacterium]|nr:flavin reductase family protein [Anaerolineales bacterium]
MTEENTTDPIKDALRMIPYGFYSITTSDGEGEVNIMVANWLSQVSFTPRLVALGLQKTSYSHGLVEKGRVFAVNLFRKEDDRIIKRFTKSRERNPDKVSEAEFTLSPTVGCPVIAGAAAVLEVKVREIVDAGGDHDVVIGEVVNAEVFKPGDCAETLTLMDLGWSYAG